MHYRLTESGRAQFGVASLPMSSNKEKWAAARKRGARVVDADNDDGSRVIMVYREACVQCMPEDGGEDGDCAAPDAPTPRFIYA